MISPTRKRRPRTSDRRRPARRRDEGDQRQRDRHVVGDALLKAQVARNEAADILEEQRRPDGDHRAGEEEAGGERLAEPRRAREAIGRSHGVPAGGCDVSRFHEPSLASHHVARQHEAADEQNHEEREENPEVLLDEALDRAPRIGRAARRRGRSAAPRPTIETTVKVRRLRPVTPEKIVSTL